MVTIVAIGKKHELWITPGLERYQKRLRQPFDVRWELLPHSSLEGDSARLEESERIRARLKPSDTVILLDERGAALDSPALSSRLQQWMNTSASVVMIIGGAYGVDQALQQRADLVWSLSPLVFPHQLVRLIVIEQLYRAQEIQRASSYHHE